MIIDAISDLHGHYPTLEGGDLLIVAGDLTARDTQEQLDEFDNWLVHQPYKKKIFIAGNHDNLLIDETPRKYMMGNSKKWVERCEYLRDSGTEFEYWEEGNPPLDRASFCRKLKIWGSPWTKTFPGMNPKCKAFTCDTEEELAVKFSLIPADTDILITHSPPFKCLDKAKRYNKKGYWIPRDPYEHVGSTSLGYALCRIQPKLHIFGHIHEEGGKVETIHINSHDNLICVNVSHVNEDYEPVNKPTRIIL
jgi:Icc-related predicted phosphoesterase